MLGRARAATPVVRDGLLRGFHLSTGKTLAAIERLLSSFRQRISIARPSDRARSSLLLLGIADPDLCAPHAADSPARYHDSCNRGQEKRPRGVSVPHSLSLLHGRPVQPISWSPNGLVYACRASCHLFSLEKNMSR